MNSQVAAALVIQIHRRRSTSSNASCAAMEQCVKFVELMYINSDVDLLLDFKNLVDVGHRPLQVEAAKWLGEYRARELIERQSFEQGVATSSTLVLEELRKPLISIGAAQHQLFRSRRAKKKHLARVQRRQGIRLGRLPASCPMDPDVAHKKAVKL